MADLTLKGTLNLMGSLTLTPPPGGKLKIGDAGLEALVEAQPTGPPQCSAASPVMLPPPPAGPAQPQPTAWIVNSFNKTVMVRGKYIAALGMVMQGQTPTPLWPGMLLPSAGNPKVTINHVPINVANDQAVIFPTGGSAAFDKSGQP